MSGNLFNWRLFWLHIKCLCQKELLVTLKDKRMRVMMTLPALIQGILFGYAGTYDLDNVPYAVVDQSHSEASRSLLAHIESTEAFTCQATLGNVSQAADYIDRQDIILALVIPGDFSRRLNKGEAAPIQLLVDGRNSSLAGLATGYLNQIVTTWNQQYMGLKPGVTIESRTWYNENQISRWTLLPAIIATIAFVQVLLLAGLSVAREREQGTFDQLLVTPLSPVEILIGKSLTPMLVGLMQSSIVFCLARFWFEIPFRGSLPVLLLTVLVFILSTIGIGLSLSAIADNMQQVMVYLVVLVMPMMLLSGMATPIDNMPYALQLFTYLDPLRFAIEAIRRIYLEGAGLAAVAPSYLPMMAIGLITMTLAGWLFQHKTA